jgi:flagellar hook-length control protein FliK
MQQLTQNYFQQKLNRNPDEQTLKGGEEMNVGALISMQNLGQLSGQGTSLKSSESQQGTLFSGMLTSVRTTEENAEPMPEGLMKLLKLMRILQSDGTRSVEIEENAQLSMENILSEIGVSEEELTGAIQHLKESIGNEVPQLKELLAQMSEQGQEDAVFQLIELIGLLPADNIKKLDSNGMEVLLKTAKAYEQAYKQTDLGFKQTEKAETLQHNLKALTQKIEQLLMGSKFAGRDWNQILEKAFTSNFPSNDTGTQNKNQLQSTNEMKSFGEHNLYRPGSNSKFLQMAQFQSNESSKGNTLMETEQQSKGTSPANLSSGIFSHQTAKIEQFSLFVNKGQSNTSYEQFAKEFANVIARSQLVQTPNMSKLLIKLYPEQLGSIRIELLQQDGVMTAKILASTKTAKEMLDSQLNGLRQAFSTQNLQVEKIEIAQTLMESNRQEKQSSQQQGGQQHKGQPGQQDHEEDETETTFKDILMNSEV